MVLVRISPPSSVGLACMEATVEERDSRKSVKAITGEFQIADFFGGVQNLKNRNQEVLFLKERFAKRWGL